MTQSSSVRQNKVAAASYIGAGIITPGAGGGVLGPLTASFAAGATAGTLIAAVTGLTQDETIASIAPNDGRLALDGTRRNLLVGLSASAAGTIAATLTTSMGRVLALTLTVSGAVPVVLGLVTKTADGSVGQTYTGPAWTSPQWYRETLASPKTRTAIEGATSRTYVATADDMGFRLVMGGLDGGTAKLAPAFAIVLPAPIVLENFDSTANLSVTAAGNPVLSVDTADKVQGAGSVLAVGQGAGNRLMRTLGALTSIAGVGSLAGLGSIVWLKEELNPYASASTSGSIRLDQTTGTPGTSGSMDGAQFANAHKGKIWNSVRPDQVAYLQGRDPSLSRKFAFDRSSAAQAPHAQRTRYDALLAKAGCRSALILRFDDAIRTQLTAAVPELVSRGVLATFYLPTDLVENSNGTGRLTWADVAYLVGLGMDMQLDGTKDDTGMTSKASPAAAIAELKAMRDLLMQRVPGTDPRHFCYPNGYTDAFAAASNLTEHRVYPGGAATGTSGSANITGMTTANMSGIAVGMKVGGFGVPAGTTVQAVDPSAGTMVLSTPLTAGPLTSIAVWDDSSPFFLDKLQDALKADGTFYTGSTTNFDTFHSRFGIADRAFLMPAYSMSNGSTGSDTDQQLADRIIARIDLAIARRENIEFYIHGVQAGGTFITTPLATWTVVLDAIVSRRDAGSVDVLTKAQWWARDGGSSCPV